MREEGTEGRGDDSRGEQERQAAGEKRGEGRGEEMREERGDERAEYEAPRARPSSSVNSWARVAFAACIEGRSLHLTYRREMMAQIAC